MRRLRQKVEPDPNRPTHLLTVRGVGYRLVSVEVGGGRMTAPSQPGQEAVAPASDAERDPPADAPAEPIATEEPCGATAAGRLADRLAGAVPRPDDPGARRSAAGSASGPG